MKKRVLLLVLAVLALTFVLVSCGHEHDFKESEVITEATCDATGKAKFVCECGESEEREIAAKGHTFGEAQVVAPTCWTEGYTYKVCSVCEAESEHTDVIEADSKYHKYDKEDVTKEPTCTTPGQKEMVCSVCDTPDPNGSAELIAALGHDYERNETPATCSQAGLITETCKNCEAPGPDNGKVIEQLPHTPEKVGETVEATCLVAGYDSYRCTVCESTWTTETAQALGHNLETTEKWHQPTCTMPGYDYYACTRCTYEDIIPGEHGAALGHDTDYANAEYTVVVAPTCITNGSITPICKRCDEKLDNAVDVNGESYVQVTQATGVHYVTDMEISSKAATCHEAAYVEYQCTTDAACTETEKRYSGTTLAHVPVKLDTIAPLCYKPGYDLYVCSICETDNTETSTCDLGCVTHENETTVPHQKTTFISKTPATCCDKAFESWECSDCGGAYPYELDDPLVPHGGTEIDEETGKLKNWLKTDEVIAPTCTSEGYTVYKCIVDPDCTVTDKQDITRRTEHPFTEYIDGRLVCNVCNVTYRDITTYIDEAVSSGKLDIDENTSLDWELKGYENPEAPAALVSGTPYVYEVKEDNAETADVDESTLDISCGIIKLSSENQATYTVVVEYGDSLSKTYTIDTANAFFDLYETDNITKVTITSTADATVSLYAYEG